MTEVMKAIKEAFNCGYAVVNESGIKIDWFGSRIELLQNYPGIKIEKDKPFMNTNN